MCHSHAQKPDAHKGTPKVGRSTGCPPQTFPFQPTKRVSVENSPNTGPNQNYATKAPRFSPQPRLCFCCLPFSLLESAGEKSFGGRQGPTRRGAAHGRVQAGGLTKAKPMASNRCREHVQPMDLCANVYVCVHVPICMCLYIQIAGPPNL